MVSNYPAGWSLVKKSGNLIIPKEPPVKKSIPKNINKITKKLRVIIFATSGKENNYGCSSKSIFFF